MTTRCHALEVIRPIASCTHNGEPTLSTTTAHRRASMLFRASVAVALLALTIPLATTPARAAFPGATGAIVFERNGDIFRRAPDGTTRNLTSGFNPDAYNPAVTQDGKWVVYDDGHDLHLVRPNGTDRRR